MTALADQIARIYGTPAVVIDLDRVDRNIARLQAACDAAGVANRPHIKTHKSPELAKLQRAGGAKGITCQKLGEAEIFADAGFDDILITYNIFGEQKEARVAALLQRSPVRLTVAADNPVTISGMAKAGIAAGRNVDIVIECDTGQKRAGVETPAEAVELARLVRDTGGVRFAGLMLYPPVDGWPQSQIFFDMAMAGLRDLGLGCDIVSTGGTPNMRNIGQLKGATEHRSGTSIFNDRMMMACGYATLEEVALHVYTTVVSRAGPERGILDAGSKTLTSDTGGLEGHGHILEHPDAKIARFSEEHGFLDLGSCKDRPEVGDIVRVIPNHVCVVVNMVDRLVTVRGDRLIGELPVAARGRLV
jgi:D-serine deaminase-like pyridoxal phosphate-dependent protein